jgi:crotonobetainyl-CoA:carnitine CoA-transferase CaiB-like acyl-CoA transferase
LHDIIEPLIRLKTIAEWEAEAEGAGFVATPVNTVAEVIKQPQAAARAAIVEVPGMTGLKSAGIPIKLLRSPGELRLSPPSIGRDTRNVLGELGLSNDDINDLIAAGVVAAFEHS